MLGGKLVSQPRNAQHAKHNVGMTLHGSLMLDRLPRSLTETATDRSSTRDVVCEDFAVSCIAREASLLILFQGDEVIPLALEADTRQLKCS